VLQLLFPHPHGGEPNASKNAEDAISLLECAKENEALGVAVLERMYNEILRGEAILG
jgi:hypothetical protein